LAEASAAMQPIVGRGDLLAGRPCPRIYEFAPNNPLHRRGRSIILLVFSRLKDALENRA
jgi:hypothetical protein